MSKRRDPDWDRNSGRRRPQRDPDREDEWGELAPHRGRRSKKRPERDRHRIG